MLKEIHVHYIDLQRFRLSVAKVCAVTQLREEMDTYILQKHTNGDSSETNQTILNIQDYMTVISPVTSEKSNVVYLQVLDAKSESKDTLMTFFFDYISVSLKDKEKNFCLLQPMLNCMKYM